MSRRSEATAEQKPRRKPRAKPDADKVGEFDDVMLDMTAMERRFVCAFLTAAGGVGSAAARMAGYAYPNEEAPRLLKRPHIKAAISAGLTTAGLTTPEILSRLADMATASMEDFIAFDDEGNYKLDLARAKRLGKLHLLKKVTPGRYGPSIELYDKAQILIQLGKWAGLSERTEVEVTENGGRDGLEEKLEALAVRLKGPMAVPVDPRVALTGPGPVNNLIEQRGKA